MLIRNIFECKRDSVINVHCGNGWMEFSRIFNSSCFETNVDFIDYAILPPGSSIGCHKHVNNEEIYLILNGTGKIQIDNEERVVKSGDIIINPNNSAHKLINIGLEDVHIFVVQVAKYNKDLGREFLSYYENLVSENSVVLGVDIGGTYTKIITCRMDGDIIDFCQEPTPDFNSSEELIQYIIYLVNKSELTEYNLLGVGIGLCGVVDSNEGEFKSSVYFPNIKDASLVQDLENLIKVPVAIDNDSNLSALGEFSCGAAKNTSVLVTLTLGTGVGAGILINGMPFYGAFGHAGECGHLLIDPNGPKCFCGKKGCLNVLSSATALVDFYKVIDKDGKENDITAQDVMDLMQKGEENAQKAFDKVCNYLGIAIANIISTLNPDCIILAGGLSCIGDLLLDKVRSIVKAHVLPDLWEETRIELSHFREKSGAVGAAKLIINKIYGAKEGRQ